MYVCMYQKLVTSQSKDHKLIGGSIFQLQGVVVRSKYHMLKGYVN